MHEFGFLAIVPPLLTVVIAVYTRNVILALALGIGCGSLILTDFHLFNALLNAVEGQVLGEISRGTQAQVILVIMVIGGFVKLLEVSGGARAFARYMLTAVSTPVKAQLLAWLSGLGIFFTDSGNSLIIGPLYRSVFEEFRLCKEKLAYILDTTSSPISILIPFIGWGAYIMGLIEQAYEEVGLTENAFAVLVKVIPFQFYAFLALLSVPIVVLSKRDYGPMLTAQRKYLQERAAQLTSADAVAAEPSTHPRERLEIFLAPLCVMLVLVIGLFIWHGTHDGVTSIHIRSTLVIAYLSASITCAVMMRHYHGVGLDKSLSVFVEGAEKLVYISIVLVLAWSLSSVTNDLKTAEYVSSLIGGTVPAALFPVLVFILGSVISLSTGSSYGTFAILMAIAVPVGSDLGASMYLTIAAVLSGGLIGDHISPISDTTVLASVGADCNHITHVTTQSAYAAVTGVVTAFAYTLAGYFETPAVLIVAILMLVVLFNVMLRYFGSEAAGTISSASEAPVTIAIRQVP
jgi:Na+/H+ antiporter NhaC